MSVYVLVNIFVFFVVSQYTSHSVASQSVHQPCLSDCAGYSHATVHSGDVTVHSGLSGCTVTSSECTVASGQRGVTDMAGGHSGWWVGVRTFRRQTFRRQTFWSFLIPRCTASGNISLVARHRAASKSDTITSHFILTSPRSSLKTAR